MATPSTTTSEAIGWGKCVIKVDEDTTGVVPVQGSTQLNVTEGSKTEAKEEGGGIVAVRYEKNTYELQFAVRTKISSLTDDDGYISGHHKVVLEPDEVGSKVLTIAHCHITCVESFSSTDGWQYTYKCAAIRPDDSTPSIAFSDKTAS